MHIVDVASREDSRSGKTSDTAAKVAENVDTLWLAATSWLKAVAVPECHMDSIWVVDSGYSNHVAGDRNLFISYTKFGPGEHPVLMADNQYWMWQATATSEYQCGSPAATWHTR
jgi:hypothetical protein